MSAVYLSLGSNLGDRANNLRAAVERLNSDDLRVLRVSPVYETAPVDFTDQPHFLNAVVEVVTTLSPIELLSRTAAIETALGRERTVPKGPRTVDIDILLYRDCIVDRPELQIPHPRLTERRFVLAPLADLAPDLPHPLAKRPVRELLEAAPPAAVRRTNLKLR